MFDLEENATEEDMLDALKNGYIVDWRVKPELSWESRFSIAIELISKSHTN